MTRAFRLCLLHLALLGLCPLATEAADPIRLSFLGEARIEPGRTFEKTTVGGLSALVYDPQTETYLALSDDPDRGGARLYMLTIDLSDGSLETEDVTVTGVLPIEPEPGRDPFTSETLDPEGLALSPDGSLYLSSEGNAEKGIPPFVGEMTREGKVLRRFQLPRGFGPGPDRGVRPNRGFEALARLPSGRLVTATESPLRQDGAAPTVTEGGTVRLLVYDPKSGRPVARYRHLIGPVAEPPLIPGAFHTNGLVELLAVDETTLLALERSYSVGRGNVIRLYAIVLGPALDRSSPLDLGATLGIDMDNVEGMTWGPELADGRRSLVMISDDNFNPLQVTQILAFAVE